MPSRLIGERLHTRVYNDRLECYLGRTFVCTLKRSANPPRGLRYRVINYRDVVDSLVKKPGAFRGSKIRNDLLPNENYQYIWKYVDRTMKDPYACRFIVGLLHLAATQNCEPELAHAVIELITNNAPLNLGELQTRFNKHKVTIPILSVSQHSLGSYNQFIPSYQEAQS